jgi:hypothetical protein
MKQKIGALALTPILGKIFKFYLQANMTPTSWNKVLIMPIPKKGDLKLAENYRSISLTETVRKLFESLLLQHLNKKITLLP